MASPSMVQRSGDTLIVRSVVSGDRLYLEPGSEQPSAAELSDPASPAIEEFQAEQPEPETPDLPQCRIKRNYDCADCDYYTQNPRHYLTHLRDVHGEKVKIYDCPHCLYASKHFQKLLRHMKMVHGINKSADSTKTTTKRKPKPPPAAKPEEEEQPEKSDPETEAQCEADESGENGELKCSLCDFTASSYNLLTRHERREHVKTKFFPCSKCNYVTHIKARFTKHVKYHSMPMIKCEVCDFHTPYKWNLDRHMKNHGGTGFFYCSACNFTADIKQSLTVHEMNHHIPAVGGGGAAAGGSGGAVTVQRRRNRVGGSDSNPLGSPSPKTRQRTRFHPRNKMRSKLAEKNESATAEVAQDDLAEITLATDNQVNVQEYETNGSNHSSNEYTNSVYDHANMDWTKNTECEEPPAKIPKKTPRPIPNLIPLNTQATPLTNKTTSNVPLNLSTITKVTNNDNTDKSETNCGDDSIDQSQYDYLSTRGSDESSQQSFPTMTKYALKRKNASIFDKLYKEKLMTASVDNGILTCKDCGHSSKSLSEHSTHEKICSANDFKLITPNLLPSGLGSTRCQFCRHRCKSSSDLINHLQTCILANRDVESPEVTYETDKIEIPTQPASEEEASVDDPQAPHPMENVVFVWNSMLPKSDLYDNTDIKALSPNSNGNFEDNYRKTKITTSTPNVESDKSKEISNLGKKVFKCPHCSFWASTASRFHVHIVGHLNKKPFECSLCSYKSNWRWDITKHIRLKSVRDPEHSKARVLMTDETGRRNYSKYNKYLTLMQVSDPTADVGASGSRKNREMIRVTDILDSDMQSSLSVDNMKNDELAEIRLQTRTKQDALEDRNDNKKNKKTMWKCKKCDYRNASKEALLVHVRKHTKAAAAQLRQEKQPTTPNALEVIPISDASSVSYRCGHCNQVSNWKHVIQRHCRLKHNGDVKVVVGTKNMNESLSSSTDTPTTNYMKCAKCPFSTSAKYLYETHLKHHTITPESTFKCFVCPYYVKKEIELMHHLPLHGLSEPEKYGAQIVNCKISGETVQFKRYRCADCPYESNSKSQFTYHEQFHKANDAPFKCDTCNYQVTKRHLLHQHMKVHGVNPSQSVTVEHNTSEVTISPVVSKNSKFCDLSLLWVSHCGEFQKMYKCQLCPYVNVRKNNVVDHSKMHVIDNSIGNENIHKCIHCSFACANLDVHLSHSKVHKEGYAKIFCKVIPSKNDEEQIADLKDKFSHFLNSSIDSNINIEDDKETEDAIDSKQKMLYFCSDCPARFILIRELQIHYKFHCLRLPYQCETCSYTARQHTHLLSHNNVHSKDYQNKTKTLQETHYTHPNYAQPKTVAVISDEKQVEPLWIVVTGFKKMENSKNSELGNSNKSENFVNAKKRLSCHKCPAKFFKSAALNYHLTLHGGNGIYKCMQCDYAVKTIGNLAKHEVVHGNEGNVEVQTDYGSGDDSSLQNVPLSGTDLYQHKTKVEKRALSAKLITRPSDHFPPVLQADPQFGLLMHGNPDFIYPTYLKNGRTKEKRYKCHKCPSAFEKREQYKVHLSLHGSKQRYKCEICDYSVKYYANYVQHMRKHQMNADAQAARLNIPSDIQAPLNGDTKLAIKSLPKQVNKDCTKISISDQQTLKLLQRRKSNGNNGKDIPDEKKIFRCTYCPYTNQRRDALDNHIKRHTCVSGISNNFLCPYCDYAAPQAQYLRDHIKVHFQQPKHMNPEYFTNFDGLTILINKLFNQSDEDKKEHLFSLKENLDVTNLKDDGPRVYVLPNSGERIS